MVRGTRVQQPSFAEYLLRNMLLERPVRFPLTSRHCYSHVLRFRIKAGMAHSNCCESSPCVLLLLSLGQPKVLCNL